MELLTEKKIFPKDKFLLLEDPVIEISKIVELKKKKYSRYIKR